MRIGERLKNASLGFLEKLLPSVESDRYYGYSTGCDDTGDEPDHLSLNTLEGREAWNQWLERHKLPPLGKLELTKE